ncbi:hypothetical protein L208DRAFT_1307292, partial [Tricholoma matsutake]
VRYLKQSVSMTGFQTPSFMAAADNLSSIYAVFTQCVPPTKLQARVLDNYEDFHSISMSNRLFTARMEAPTDPALDLGREVDPDGKLAELGQGQYFHGKDNKVRYWERMANHVRGGYKYIPTSPMRIQVGDVVKAKLSFLAVPLRGGSFKMMVVLRDLTLLDGNYTHKQFSSKKATAAHTLCQVQPTLVTTPLKRHIEYQDEQEGEARTKLSRMELDEQQSEP